MKIIIHYNDYFIVGDLTVSVIGRLHGRHPYDGSDRVIDILRPFFICPLALLFLDVFLFLDNLSRPTRRPLNIPGLLFVVTDETGIGLHTVTVGHHGHGGSRRD